MKIYSDFDLTNYNSYKIKAFCKRAFFPENEEDFIKVFENSETKKIIIGGGYNIILAKEYYDEDFVIISETYSKIEVLEDNIVACQSGASTIALSEFALGNSLSGVEIFYDIPSSIGGAVVMNAGASGEEIKDVLTKVRYLDLVDLKIKEVSKEEINYRYRNSIFQEEGGKVVLRAWLQLQPGDKSVIQEKMERVKAARWEKQPKEFPNAGSVFKRPPGRFVGPMMDELGLKGFRIGGAEISKKHGGFIINVGNATGEDILQVIKHAKNMVREKFDVELEIEQRII